MEKRKRRRKNKLKKRKKGVSFVRSEFDSGVVLYIV